MTTVDTQSNVYLHHIFTAVKLVDFCIESKVWTTKQGHCLSLTSSTPHPSCKEIHTNWIHLFEVTQWCICSHVFYWRFRLTSCSNVVFCVLWWDLFKLCLFQIFQGSVPCTQWRCRGPSGWERSGRIFRQWCWEDRCTGPCWCRSYFLRGCTHKLWEYKQKQVAVKSKVQRQIFHFYFFPPFPVWP